MSQLSRKTLKEILRYIQQYKVTPNSIPGCDEEELHEHFTCLVNEGLVVGENVILTLVGEVVLDVMIPKLTLEGRQLLDDPGRVPAIPKASAIPAPVAGQLKNL